MAGTVMIVDDAVSIRGLASMTLENAGYGVIEARDGREALALLRSHRVNLVITDVNMPNMGGIELVRALKADPAHRFIPVVILTKETAPELKGAGRAAGARAWVTKPFTPRTILSVTRKIIG